MSNISPIGQPNPAILNRSTGVGRAPASEAPAARGADRAEFSRSAQLLSKLAELPEVRQDLIDRVRAEIENGTYDTPDKVDSLLDSLLEDLA